MVAYFVLNNRHHHHDNIARAWYRRDWTSVGSENSTAQPKCQFDSNFLHMTASSARTYSPDFTGFTTIVFLSSFIVDFRGTIASELWIKKTANRMHETINRRQVEERRKNDFSAPFCSNKLVAVTLFFLFALLSDGAVGAVGITYSRFNFKRRKSATKCFLKCARCVFSSLSLLAEHHVGAWLLQNLNTSDCTKTRDVWKWEKKNTIKILN